MEPGDTVSRTLKKEFGEEALNSLEVSDEEKREIEAHINQLFKEGEQVCLPVCLCTVISSLFTLCRCCNKVHNTQYMPLFCRCMQATLQILATQTMPGWRLWLLTSMMNQALHLEESSCRLEMMPVQ